MLALLSVAVPGRPACTLSIHDGRVTLDAQDVTVRQILTEWARVGKTRIVNGERISAARSRSSSTAFPKSRRSTSSCDGARLHGRAARDAASPTRRCTTAS